MSNQRKTELGLACPLSGETNLEILETIRAEDLVKLYKLNNGVDISSEFSTPFIRLVRNPSIGFCFFDPLVSGSSKFYRDFYARLPYNETKEEYGWAAKHIKEGVSVLDIGCGEGYFKNYVPKALYHGLEFNENSIAKCKAKGISVSADPVQEVARRGCQYDCVVLFQVLEHVSDPGDFFEAAVACVRHGGTLIVSVPNLDCWMTVRENTNVNYPPHHMTWWSLETFLFLGRKHGLEFHDFHEEKVSSLSFWAEAAFKSRLNARLGRKPSIIRLGRLDRMVNKFFNQMGRLLPRPPERVAPNGHSITVVFRKRQ